jgi:hypothetical protein
MTWEAAPNQYAVYILVRDNRIVKSLTLNTTEFPYPAQEVQRRWAGLVGAIYVQVGQPN